MSYCRKCGAELVNDARFCSACGTPVAAPSKPIEAHKTLKVSGKPKIIVTVMPPGVVEVKKGSEGEVAVDLDLRKPEELDCSISQDDNTVTVKCRSQVHPLHWAKYAFSQGPKADVFIAVPEEADLDLESSVGPITITGVKGKLEAETSVGTMKIRDCEGIIKVRTKAGSINLENIIGTITARSSAGSIEFNGALSKGENWFKTSVGRIEIVLQGKPDLTVDASSRVGRVTCDLELVEARYDRFIGGRCTGRIGAGAGKLIAETETGSIKIR
ncbi:MAG: DUF4097 family beta strand repeat protein [Candidatus Bathyarchaeota archaeon]|nr:MAG: DUF4097 family beta strand repeat protein [Candidatus Bathyarchaeota archaeon]